MRSLPCQLYVISLLSKKIAMEQKEKIKFGVGGGALPKFDYEGSNTCENLFKLVLMIVVIIMAYYHTKSRADFWLYKKKKEYDQNVTNKTKENTQEFSPQPPFKTETLNEACYKPHTDVSELQMCGNILSRGDTMILFSPDGEGKSTLAAGMCIDIASGSKTKLLPESMVLHANKPQPVLWIDAELNEDDIQMRFGQHGYRFPDNLYRTTSVYGSVDEMFNHIEKFVDEKKSDVTICIDNLSAIIPPTSANAFIELFKKQKMIKDKAMSNGTYVTFIIIAHSKKTESGRVSEDFYGSSYIGNLSSTRIALLPTRLGKDYKMLKVQKNRKFALDDNVIVIKRVTTPYLHFEYYDTMSENEVVPLKQKNVKINNPVPVSSKLVQSPKKAPNQKVTPDKEEKIMAMHSKGMNQNTIAKKMKLSTKTVHRTLERLKNEGRISA